MNKFSSVWVFTSSLDSGHMSSGVVIIMNVFLARYMSKVFEIPGWLLFVKLLFKNKLSMLILRLYTADKINFFIAKTVNESSFIILSKDFNKGDSCKCAKNSRGVKKTIDYVFVSPNLVNVIIHYDVLEVGKHFDMDYQTVLVFIGLGGLLDKWLNSFHKQTEFKNATLANTVMFPDEFAAAVKFLDLDIMWDVVHKMMCLLANKVFKKKWFMGYNSVFTKKSSKFHKLEVLVSRIVKASHEGVSGVFKFLMGHWKSLNIDKTLPVRALLDSGVDFDHLAKSLWTEKSKIRSVVNKQIENFVVDKGYIIRSMLEHPFRKMVLDHLMVENELILKSNLVKAKVDPLNYVFDDAFLSMMCLVGFDELLGVISDLPDGKATGLSGISNKLWKHCDKSVIDMFLILLNSCLTLKTGYVEFQAGLTFFLAVGAFVDDTIWVGNSQAATQHILNVASEFFRINDISINNNKTVAILINCGIKCPSLLINGLFISITKKKESYQYLGIFLFMDSLSKPSLTKIHLNVRLSVNFLGGIAFPSASLSSLGGYGFSSILKSNEFRLVCEQLLDVVANTLSVYMDGFLRNLGSADMSASTAVFFENVNLDLGVRAFDLLSFTLVKLQTIALALKCVLFFSLVCLYTDSQTALDVCKLELSLVHPDFWNWC
ncbi:hypothetical protein G9A89_011887 [Geosiphon pyriformis]|nr:hypothetical protein G9A89_011887 [Geosiphon pyriformis]